MNRHIGQEIIDKIILDYQAGFHTATIAKRLDISTDSVRYHLIKNNFYVRRDKDLTATKFGRLQPIKMDGLTTDRKTRWECLCDCGNTVYVTANNLKSGAIRSCKCLQKESSENFVSRTWESPDKRGVLIRRYEEISADIFTRAKVQAEQRGLEYNVSQKYLWDLFISQNRKCALSGVLIGFVRNIKKRKGEGTASLDRINSTKGYIEGNLQWVHKEINRMKSNMTDQEFIQICKNVSDCSWKNKEFCLDGSLI